MNNLEIRRFEQSIIEFIDSQQIPLEVKRLCLQDILTKVETSLNVQLIQEFEQENSNKEVKEDGIWKGISNSKRMGKW